MTTPGSSAPAARPPSQDDFRDWLEAMHPRLARFVDFLLPPGTRRDYSRGSLAELEALLLRRYPDRQSFHADPDTDFGDGTVRYIGEALLRSFGGGWGYTDDPGSLFVGQPFVELDTEVPVPVAPLYLVRAVLSRRTGGELARVWDGQLLNLADQREIHGPDWTPSRDPLPGITPGTGARREANRDLDAWVARVPGLVAAAVAGLGLPAGADPFSVESLDAVEGRLLAGVPGTLDLGDAAAVRLVEESMAFLGEMALAAAGGEWALTPGDRAEGWRFGWPFLQRIDADGDDEVLRVYLSVDAVLDARERGWLRRGYEGYCAS